MTMPRNPEIRVAVETRLECAFCGRDAEKLELITVSAEHGDRRSNYFVHRACFRSALHPTEWPFFDRER
jgi:hypothetical protein